MEPKDLKNSEELKSKADASLTGKTPEEVKPAEKTEVPVAESEKQPEKAAKPAKAKKTVVEEPSQTDTAAEAVQEVAEEKAAVPVEEVEEEVVEEKAAVVAEEKTEEVIEETAAETVQEVAEEKAVVPVEDVVEEVVEEKAAAVAEEKTEAVVEDVPVNQAEEEEEIQEESSEEEIDDEEGEEDENGEDLVGATGKRETTKKKEVTDYSEFTQVDLVNALRSVLENPDEHDLKEEIEAIKSVFYKNKNDALEEAKKAFLEAGGAEEDFVEEDDPYEKDIKDLLRDYRQIRIDYNKKLDVEKEENLKRKYEVIENIKGLINNEESINKTFNEFRDLQREWREIGLVPQAKMKNLWDLYHFHVENFYDYIKINRELRDLDLKKNLELKIELCEKTEELLVEPSIIRAFNQLQKYHEEWREIGPVPRENKDDIWERFKLVTSKINKKHQDFFESRKVDQKKNLEAKTALCEKVEEISQIEIDNYKDWDSRSKELVELQKVWRTIGFAPKKDNNKIYERFRTACDEFFNKKREFYSRNKEIQQNNLQKKIDLCIQAEALKESTDWKKTTQDLINIQKEWKDVGPIPRKHSDALWNRFRAACDFFFDKKSEHFSDVDTEQVDNLKLKEELITEVENFKSVGDANENLKILKEFQRRWTEIGHVPFKKKDETQNRFREAINVLYDELNINEDKRNMLKFKSKMTSYTESNRGMSKMRMEREKYMNKLKQLENDLVLLDNNIGFFAKSKNAESLIKDVKKKIEDTKQKIEMLKEKIRVIDALEDNQ